MNKFITYLIIIIGLLVTPVSYSAETSVMCGMEDTAEGMKVKSRSGEICEEDVYFQSLYIMFSNTLKDPATKFLVTLFVDEEVLDSNFTKFADETIGVSGPIHFILSAVAILVWALITPLLAIQGYRYVLMVKKTGQVSFAEGRGDTIQFVGFTAFLLMLLMPVGFSSGEAGDKPPLMVGQSLAIIGALPAGMGGNYFFSTYLSATEVGSSDVPIKEKMLLPTGQGIANGLIEGGLCEINTRQAIMNMRAKTGSSFFSGKTAGEAFDYDQESISDRYDICLSYVGDIQTGILDRTINTLSINKFTRNDEAQCSGYINGYDNDAYGDSHSCMSVKYNYGENKFPDIESVVDGENDYSEGLRERFNAPYYYGLFKHQLRSKMLLIIDDENKNPKERFDALEELILNDGAAVFDAGLTGSSALSDGSNDEKQARHLAVAAMLLGGTIEMSSLENLFENRTAAIWSYSRVYNSISDNDLVAYGLDPILHDARETAELIRAHNCALNWERNHETRRFILDYNRASSFDDMEALFGGSSVKMQCVKFLDEDNFGSDDRDRYATYVTGDGGDFADFRFSTEKNNWEKIDSEDTAKAMVEVVAPAIQKTIQLNQFLISGYTASVKKAVTQSLVDNLSKSDDDALRDIALRPRGWGMFGGALLYTGQTQGSSSHMASSLSDVFLVESGSTNNSYISNDAFGSMSEAENVTLGQLFNDYDSNLFFSIGPTGAASPIILSDVPEDMNEESSMQYFMSTVESLLLGPMDHIKAASGMPLDKSLSYGLQSCFEGGYDSCFSGSKHPIVALSDFGNEMVNNMIILMVTTEISKAASKMSQIASGEGSTEGDTDETGKKKKKSGLQKVSDGVKNFIKGLKSIAGGVVMVFVKIILGILEIATVVLDFLKPLFATLLMVGIVFAYIIPMMAYIFGFMIMVLNLVAIFTTAVIIPFYIFSKFMTLEKEYKNGFKSFYQDMLGAYLTPMLFSISATISWSLIVVVMYAINMTFSLINHGLTSSSEAGFSGISSLVFNVFMYVIYFISIFVLFRFVLGLMKSLSDTMKERLNFKRGDDDNYINSLGFEQYVKATTMKQLAQMPSEMVAAIANHVDKGGYKSMDDLRGAVAEAESVAERLGLNNDNAEERGREDAAKLDKMEAEAEARKESDNKNSDNDTPETPGGGSNDSDRTESDEPEFVDEDESNTEKGEPTAVPDDVREPGDESLEPEFDSKGKPKVIMTLGDSTDTGDKDK